MLWGARANRTAPWQTISCSCIAAHRCVVRTWRRCYLRLVEPAVLSWHPCAQPAGPGYQSRGATTWTAASGARASTAVAATASSLVQVGASSETPRRRRRRSTATSSAVANRSRTTEQQVAQHQKPLQQQHLQQPHQPSGRRRRRTSTATTGSEPGMAQKTSHLGGMMRQQLTRQSSTRRRLRYSRPAEALDSASQLSGSAGSQSAPDIKQRRKQAQPQQQCWQEQLQQLPVHEQLLQIAQHLQQLLQKSQPPTQHTPPVIVNSYQQQQQMQHGLQDKPRHQLPGIADDAPLGLLLLQQARQSGRWSSHSAQFKAIHATEHAGLGFVDTHSSAGPVQAYPSDQQQHDQPAHQQLLHGQGVGLIPAAAQDTLNCLSGRSHAPAQHSMPTPVPALAFAETHSISGTAHSSSNGTAHRTYTTEEQQQQLLHLEELLADQGISLPRLRFGQQRTECPNCNNGSQHEDCFSVNLIEGGRAVWTCHRATCGWTGHARIPKPRRTAASNRNSSRAGVGGSSPALPDRSFGLHQAVPAVKLPHPDELQPLSDEFLQWFKQRGISAATIQRNKVMMQSAYYSAALRQCVPHIAFPFYYNGQIVNVKYRAVPKHFTQSEGGQQVFYGLDDIKGASNVIIVEGELDKLSIEEATGNSDVLSIPAGAAPIPRQQQNQMQTPELSATYSSQSSPVYSDKKFAYVQHAQHLLSNMDLIVIAVDGDQAGFHTACELAKRLGPERCRYVPWPASVYRGSEALQHVAEVARTLYDLELQLAAGAKCKDANDVLIVYGKEGLKLYLQYTLLPFTEVLASMVNSAST